MASLSSNSLTFVVPLTLVGAGAGLMIAPIMTVAMHRIEPAMAGAASGMLNTSRQLGAAVGAAVVGAIMQNQLLTAMRDRAVTDSAQLPAAFRQRFVDGVSNAAANGFDVGRGQSGGVQLPAGLPPQAVHVVQQLVHDVFVKGYLTAMRPTLTVPAAALALGAVSCLLIARRRLSVPAADPNVMIELAS